MKKLCLLLVAACAPAAKSKPVAAPVAVARAETAPVDVKLPGCMEHCTKKASDVHAVMLRYAGALQNARSFDEKKRADAVRALDKLVRDYPWFAPGYRTLGATLTGRSAWVPAYVAYSRYLGFELYPLDRSKVSSELGLLESKQPTLAAYGAGERAANEKDWPRVVTQMQDVLQQRSNFVLAYRLLGIAHEAQRHHFDAIEAFENYLKLDDLAPDRADIERRLKLAKDAVAAMKKPSR